jgi:hypothetical protein
MDKAAMTERHVLFQEEDKNTYVRDMLALSLHPQPAEAHS